MKKSIFTLIFFSLFSTPSIAFDNVVSFGDSLSDGGAQDFFGSKTRYISGDDTLLYNEILSLNLTNKNLVVSTEGGNNYSLSGATASNTPLLIYKTEQQVDSYLEKNNGKASKQDLYIFWAGANDITTDVEMSLLKLNLGNLFNDGVNYQLSDAPQAVARQVGTLLERGAGLVVVPNLPNAGLSPWTATALFGFTQMLLGGNVLDLPSLYMIQDSSLRQQGNVYGEEQRQEAIITSLSTVLTNYGLRLPHDLIANIYRTLLAMENRLTQQFNHDLESSLTALKGNIAYVDSYALFQEMIDSPLSYGFDNILVPVCQIGVAAPFCNKTQPSWHDDQTYLFSDWFHPSPEAHQVIAQYITSLINAPLVITKLAEPVQSLMLGQNSFLMSQLFLYRQKKMSTRPYRIFGGYQGHQMAHTSSLRQQQGSSNLGVIIGVNESVAVGGAFSIGNTNNLKVSPQLHTDYTHRTLSLFGQLLLGQSWLSTQISMGEGKFDHITRTIPLGKALRKERATTKDNHFSGSINAGYDFTLGEQFTHGPHTSVIYRKGKVHGFIEKSTTSSSMKFSRYRFSDSYLSLGWHVSSRNNHINPFLEVNYIHPLYKKESSVRGGLKSTNSSFSTIVKNKDSSTINIKLGSVFDINNRTQAFISAEFPKIRNTMSNIYYSAGLNFTF